MASPQAPLAESLSPVESLPPELLSQIFDIFNVSAPSDNLLLDQPRTTLLQGNSPLPLKCISLVSKRWRAVSLPMLFRYVVWTVDHCDQLFARPVGDADPVDEFPILAFLRATNLARRVLSLTILVYPVQLRPAGAVVSDPSSSALAGIGSGSSVTYGEDSNWLWSLVFGLLDPLRFTILASPQTLARLLSCMLFVGDPDCFPEGERLHILSLARSLRSTGARSQSLAVPGAARACSLGAASPSTGHDCPEERKHTPSALLRIRPWTHLLLNENSSIPIYRHYHYFERRQPSILGALLGCEEAPNNVPMLPPTVASLSYAAIFPFSSQFGVLADHLPPVRRLFLRLAPGPRDLRLLLDRTEMAYVESSDLWMECRTCYDIVARRMLSAGPLPASVDAGGAENGGEGEQGDDPPGTGDTSTEEAAAVAAAGGGVPGHNWKFVQRLESGDASLDAASLMAEALEGDDGGQTGWRVEREGDIVAFVRGPPTAS